MNRKDAIEYMVERIEEIERERLAENLSIDPKKQMKATVEKILKALREVEIDDEDY